MKFNVRYFNITTRSTELHKVESKTVGQALKTITALMMGKDTKDLTIIQEDEE